MKDNEFYKIITSNEGSDAEKTEQVRSALMIPANLAFINSQVDAEENTLLHLAANRGFFEIAKLLRNHGANVFLSNKSKYLPHECAKNFAVEKGFVNLIEAYEEKLNNTNLVVHSSSFDERIATYCYLRLAYEADLKLFGTAITSGKSFKRLIKTYNDIFFVNAVDPVGNTALHIAAENANNVLLQSLINQGADTQKRNSSGQSPLVIALLCVAEKCSLKEIDRFLAENKKNVSNNCSLKASGHLESAYLLLLTYNKGQSTDYPGLINAANTQMFYEIQKILAARLEHNVNHARQSDLIQDLKEAFEEFPLHTAAQLNNTMLVKKYLSLIPVDTFDHEQNTALHYAAEEGALACIKILLEKNPKILKNKGRLTPIDLARISGHKDCEATIQKYYDKKEKASLNFLKSLSTTETKKPNKKRNKKKPKDSSTNEPSGSIAKIIQHLNIPATTLGKAANPSTTPTAIREYCIIQRPLAQFSITENDFTPEVLEIINSISKEQYFVAIRGGFSRSVVYRFFHNYSPTINDFDLITNMPFNELKELLFIKKFGYIANGRDNKITLKINTTPKPINISAIPELENIFYEIMPNSDTNLDYIAKIILDTDITINAFCIDYIRGLIFYTPDAQLHIKDKLIVTTQSPVELFNKVSCSTLRVIRFAFELNFSINEATYSAIPNFFASTKFLNPNAFTKYHEHLKKIFISYNEKLKDEKKAILDVLKAFTCVGLKDNLTVNPELLIGKRKINSLTKDVFIAATDGDIEELLAYFKQKRNFNITQDHITPLMATVLSEKIDFEQKINCICFMLEAGADIQFMFDHEQLNLNSSNIKPPTVG